MSYFINESAVYQEPKMVKNYPKRDKAVFRACVQTVDVVNQNKRKYPRPVLEGGVKQLEPLLNNRCLYNELDHPLKTGDKNFDIVRQTTVLLKRASHLITNFEFSGHKLMAEMETLNTWNGKQLYGLLLDKTGIGFSMRGLGELGNRNGYYEVMPPLTIICFDSVSRPSHSGAVVDLGSVRFENKEYKKAKNSSLILESEQIQDHGDIICAGGKCFLADYFDKLIEHKIIKISKQF